MKKKIFAIAIALMMLVIYSAAFAWTITIEENDKITVSIKPMDIYTGEILDAKTYVEDTQFCLQVKVDVPKSIDVRHCELKLATKGLALAENTIVPLESGEYKVCGIVVKMPAVFQVQIKDTTVANAQTAEELVAAAKRVDQTQTITYNFGQVAQVAPNANVGMVLPKTGDMSMFVPAFCMVSAVAAAVSLYNRKRR